MTLHPAIVFAGGLVVIIVGAEMNADNVHKLANYLKAIGEKQP